MHVCLYALSVYMPGGARRPEQCCCATHAPRSVACAVLLTCGRSFLVGMGTAPELMQPAMEYLYIRFVLPPYRGSNCRHACGQQSVLAHADKLRPVPLPRVPRCLCRALASPAVMIINVSQGVCLGQQDAWTPLRCGAKTLNPQGG